MMYMGKVNVRITEGCSPEHIQLEAVHDLTGCEISYSEVDQPGGKKQMVLNLKLYIKDPPADHYPALDDPHYVCDHQRIKDGPGPSLCWLCALEALDEAYRRRKKNS